MKKIERIREDYDIITEKDDSDTRKLTSLVRAGLFDQNKLPMLKRALQKDPSKLTMAERKGLLELLDSLMSQVLHSQSVYSKVKQNVGSEVNEAYPGRDPRFGNSAAVSERDMPTVIILKRKSIRVYPDNQKVGLYYSQYLDRYIAIPFGLSKQNVPYTSMNEELDEALDYAAIHKDYVEDNPNDEEAKKKKVISNPEMMKKFVMKKAAQGKIRATHYSGANDTGRPDADKKELRKAANDYISNTKMNPLDKAATRLGLAAGAAVRNWIGNKNKKTTSKQEILPPKKSTTKVIASKSNVIDGELEKEKPALLAPEAKPEPPKGFNVTAQFIKPTTASAEAKPVSPPANFKKVKNTASPAPVSEPQSAPSKPNVRASQLPIKQKFRASLRRMKEEKLEEKKQIKEQAVAKAIPLAVNALGAMGAGVAGYLASKSKTGKIEIPSPVDVSVNAMSKTIGAAKQMKDIGSSISNHVSSTMVEPATKKKINPGNVMAKAAKDDFDASQKTSSSEFSKLDHVDTPPPAKMDTAGTAASPQQVKGTDVAPPIEVKAPAATPTAVSAPSTAIPAAAAVPAVASVAATKGASLKDKAKGGGRRPLFFPGGSETPDDKKELTPAKFGLNVKLNAPKGDVMTGVDKRMSNAYRKSFETSVKEEVTTTDDEEKKTGRRFFKPAAPAGSKVKINAPQRAGVKTGVDARMSKYERDYYGQQNESVMSQIKVMVKEDVTEMQLNIGENTLKINNTIAKKVVGVYESLNKQNKKKMENMLNEGTTESFMKLINFAVRQ